MRLVVTGGHRDRVVVLNIVGKKKIEPVCVPELGLPQVSGFGFRGVRKRELSGDRVVLTQHLVHLAIDSAVGGIGDFRIIQITFLLKFLIDGHLILRVHNVECVVGRLEPVGIFPCVADAALSGLSFFRCDDDDARHGAGPID